MILILSTENTETSTEMVIDWINALDGKYLRINIEDLTLGPKPYSIVFSGTQKKIHFNKELLNDIHVIWYRKWHMQYGNESLGSIKDGDLAIRINHHLNGEAIAASYGLFTQFPNAHWLDHPKDNRVLLKPVMLEKAQQAGLRIPPSLITNNKNSALAFLKEQNKIITKCISDGVFITAGEKEFGMYTIEVTAKMLKSWPDTTFYPTLFQKMIEKRYELRRFYLDKDCYSMAIFSQKDPKTKLDFRRYNLKKFNRYVPYLLPEHIKTKIIELMTALNLKCASIDMIREENGEYCFLEVNPLGQFGMVSGPCNFYLEKEVAKYLIEYDIKKAKTAI